jgi:L(+)-tartrate dehydratase alpha subunit
MISRNVLEDAIFRTIKKGACHIPPDVYSAFQNALRTEHSALSRQALDATLQSLDKSMKLGTLACGDTGWPLFFWKVGDDAVVEGGITGLEEISKKMVAKASREGYLRKTMKHPLTGYDPGDNVGMNVPNFSYKFVPGNSVQVTFVPKGGGSECFGGTQSRMIAFADGTAGIEKFIIDSYVEASRAGAVCPPSVIGVGIGGTSEMCVRLAKEASVLRTIGSHHPEMAIAKMETDLFNAINELKIGAMGFGGDTSLFCVNIEYSYTHIAGIAVAMSANCFIARRATTKIRSDGSTEELDNPDWFGGR